MKLLTRKYAAIASGVSPSTVCKYVKEGIIRPKTQFSKAWMFDEKAVNALMVLLGKAKIGGVS